LALPPHHHGKRVRTGRFISDSKIESTMLTNEEETLTRLRELLIKRNECRTKACAIEMHVESLVQEAEAKPQRRDDILHEIEQNHIRVKQIITELEAIQPEMERLTEILGDDVVLEEISKHPVTFSVSVN